MPGRRHSCFYRCPMRGRRGDFAQLDCMHVTLHFESPDPFSGDHEHPAGASCHRGSISPGGSSRNSSLELPGTIVVLARFLSLIMSATLTFGLKVVQGCRVSHDKVNLAVTWMNPNSWYPGSTHGQIPPSRSFTDLITYYSIQILMSCKCSISQRFANLTCDIGCRDLVNIIPCGCELQSNPILDVSLKPVVMWVRYAPFASRSIKAF